MKNEHICNEEKCSARLVGIIKMLSKKRFAHIRGAAEANKNIICTIKLYSQTHTGAAAATATTTINSFLFAMQRRRLCYFVHYIDRYEG